MSTLTYFCITISEVILTNLIKTDSSVFFSPYYQISFKNLRLILMKRSDMKWRMFKPSLGSGLILKTMDFHGKEFSLEGTPEVGKPGSVPPTVKNNSQFIYV